MESRKRVNQPVKQDENKVKRVKKTMNVLFGGQGINGAGAPSATTSEEDTATSHTSSTSQTTEHTPDHAGSNQVNLADTLPVVTGPGANSTSTTRKRLKRILESGVLGPVTNVLGPIKQVAEIFVECVDTYKVGDKTKVEYEELIARLEALFEDLVGYFEDGCSQPMTASMRRLCKSIQEELESIQDKKGRGIGARYLVANDETDAILAHYRRVEGYLERLSLNANLSMWKITHEQSASYQSDRMSSLIDRLPSVLSARYNSAEGEALKRRECTPGTRVQEIAMVLGWVRNRGDGAVYWLNGMAGTGKTTIAYSTCAALDSAHMLGASFFCSRLRDECRNVNMIIPSIAYQLARFSRPFHHALCNALENDPDAHGKQLLMQFNTLIKEPILHIQHTLPEELIVVIDALDECENKESTGRMLDVLLRESARLPIRFVLSSRPEPEIRDQMSEQVRSRLVLHELDKGKVQVDIETYLRAELSRMSPSEEQIASLVDKAGILFIYAATAVRYIGYDNFQSDPHDRLRTILATSESEEDGENEEIDQLYTTVLEAALGNRKLRKAERNSMQQVLHTVVCARDPLTVSGLSELLRIHNIDRVRAVLRPLWSILHIVGESELVTTLHASFSDFIFDPIRSKAYHCDSTAHNCILAQHCLERIKRTKPQFNICGLESSYLPDDMVPNIEERVADAISFDLLYACRYWADHVGAGECVLALAVDLQDFLSTRLLIWMEVLNLNKQMRTGIRCMKLAVQWRSLESIQELAELANDALRFVDTFASNSISQSTPHIYMSMMTFWPRSAAIAKHYT
ncbi:putative vegetative incompatibility protein HET-E-1 [Rhizoctonia solani 123E]|uniref:Putative vegetative incompatibility protein HET-E-1 n=1 Tax=Rhizoctonia solani 123E TaxID=1423351 RepID=A0A074RMY3_9AGAM|nr:putative vegetative incompatibility protein HET-E-1 [Rhizoctonia solani 123E]